MKSRWVENNDINAQSVFCDNGEDWSGYLYYWDSGRLPGVLELVRYLSRHFDCVFSCGVSSLQCDTWLIQLLEILQHSGARVTSQQHWIAYTGCQWCGILNASYSGLYSTPFVTRPTLRHWSQRTASPHTPVNWSWTTKCTAAQPWDIQWSVFLVYRTDPMECVAGRSATGTVHEHIEISLKTRYSFLMFSSHNVFYFSC